jgi:hypothetical protein
VILVLNPLLEALEAARHAAAGVIHSDDEVTVEDRGDQWIFEFVPRDESKLGGGASVIVAKDDFRIIKFVRGQ